MVFRVEGWVGTIYREGWVNAMVLVSVCVCGHAGKFISNSLGLTLKLRKGNMCVCGLCGPGTCKSRSHARAPEGATDFRFDTDMQVEF